MRECARFEDMREVGQQEEKSMSWVHCFISITMIIAHFHNSLLSVSIVSVLTLEYHPAWSFHSQHVLTDTASECLKKKAPGDWGLLIYQADDQSDFGFIG